MRALTLQNREVRALTRGMLSNYRWMVNITVLIAVAMIIAATITPFTPALNEVEAFACLLVAAAFCVCTAVFVRVKRRYMYLAMASCVLTAAVALTIGLANAMFGAHGPRLYENSQPFILMYIPIVVLFAYTYLEQSLADRLLMLMVPLHGSMVLAYMLINRDVIIDWSGVWLCLGFCTLVPVHAAVLVKVHLRIQSTAVHLKNLHQQELVEENRRLRKLERIDPLSHGLNELGMRETLQQQFRQGLRVRLAVARIKDYERLQRRLSPDEETSFLRRLAQILSGALGSGVKWGMNSERQFVFWTPHLDEDAFMAAIEGLRIQLAQTLRQSNTRCELFFGTASSGPELENNPDLAPALLIHDAELALFKSMIGGFVSDSA